MGQANRIGRGRSMNVLQMDDSNKERVFGEDAEISTTGSGLQGEGKELRNLGANMLGEVFSYLPQKQLFEVMSVSRDWEKAVMEGSGLWKKVDVRRKWDLGGEGGDMAENEILRRVIGFAEDVTFSEAFRGDEKHVMSVGGWLAPNLRILELPSESVLPTFFVTLVSKCSLLESLVVGTAGNGNLALGNDPVHIRHPNLKSLRLSSDRPEVVSIDCSALTHLSIFGELRGGGTQDSDTLCAPSLFCPKLKSLCLTGIWRDAIHYPKFAEAVAANAPNITSLEATMIDESPIIALTRFKALQVLRIQLYERGRGHVFPPHAFTTWPLLESLELYLHEGAKDVEVAHRGLKSLDISTSRGPMSPIVSCISLEHLTLCCVILEAKCLKNLDQSCPKLKRLDLSRLLSGDRMHTFGFEDEADGPLEIEKVEELRMRNFTRSSVRVACSNLKKLVMSWWHPVSERVTVSATLRLPTLECPQLKCLELFCYDHMFRSIPAMLSVLPELESLRCTCAHEDLEDVVLEHQNLRDVAVMSPVGVHPRGSVFKLKRLTLVMPSLVRKQIVETIRVLVVKDRK